MPRLGDRIPTWVVDYLDIPFAQGGRDRHTGVDCWGLVRIVQAERFGVSLPDHHDAYVAPGEARGLTARIAEVMGAEMAGGSWSEVRGPGPGGAEMIASPSGGRQFAKGYWGVPGDARVGDVAVFRRGRDPWHVGLLVARGRMLHAIDGRPSCIERLDGPRWAARLDRVLRYAGPVRILARPRPFREDRIDIQMTAGASIAEMLRAAGVAPDAAAGVLRVFLGDTEVPHDRWCVVKPRPGRTITVTAVPAGGGGSGKDTLRIVLSIAVVVAAVAAPYALGLTGLPAALTAAGVSLAGNLAIVALIPPSRPRLTEAGPDTAISPTIAGARNEARPYSPIPVVLGMHRITPPYGALPYTEVIGDAQYLRLLFVVGYGPLEISDLRIGETPLEEFEGVEVQVREGYAGDAPITLYPGTVIETSLAAALAYNEPALRTGEQNAQEISLDITFPQGLFELNAAGVRVERTVQVRVEYAPAGSGSWTTVNAASPSGERQMDYLFRTPEVAIGGSGIHSGRIAWGLLFPDGPRTFGQGLPGSGFSWIAEGAVYVDQAGEWSFGIDCSDAGDVTINDRIVASWYGQHGTLGGATPDFTGHNGTINLTRGWHRLRVRVEVRPGAGTLGAIALGYRAPGAGAWSIVPASALTFPGASGTGVLRYRWYVTTGYGGPAGVMTVTAARGEPIRRSLAWAVAPGQYDVRLTRLTPNSSGDRIYDQCAWTALRTIRGDDPVQVPGLARIALRIKATDQLNGVIDSFNCLAEAVLPDWDASADSGAGAWITRATRSPAAAYRAVLQGPANKRPLGDIRIALSPIQAWSEACREKGLEYNAVLDTPGTVYERLRDIAAAGLASPAMLDGLHSVIRDVPQSVPVQHFTPRNSSGFRGTRRFPDLPHGFRVGILNERKRYERDEIVVLADGYQIAGLDAFGAAAPTLPPATRLETIEFAGVTDPDQAWRLGRYHLAVGRLRPETYELATGAEHLVCTRGDLVLVSHDVPLWGLGSGRVLAVITDTGGAIIGLQLDDEVVFEQGLDFRLRVRLADGASWVRDLSTPVQPGPAREVRFQPVSAGEPAPEPGDLWMFGRVGTESRECVVKSIAYDRDLGARLELVDAAPAIHQADSGTIPEFDPGLSIPPAFARVPAAPVIGTVVSGSGVNTRAPGGQELPAIVVPLSQPSGSESPAVSYQVRWRPLSADGTAEGPWAYLAIPGGGPCLVTIGPVETARTYALAARAIGPGGRPSAWTLEQHTVAAPSIRPPAPATLTVERLGDGTRRISWTFADSDPALAGVVIRYGEAWQTWDQMMVLHAGVLAGSPFETVMPGPGAWTFRVRSVDRSGVESLTEASCSVTLPPSRETDAAVSSDERFAGWPGTASNASVQIDGTLAADDNGVGGWLAPIVYESPAIDAGAEIAFAPAAYVEADGYVSVEVAWSSDDVIYTDWVLAGEAAGITVAGRYLKVRVTVQDNGDYPRAVLRQCQAIMRAPIQEVRVVGLDPALLPAAYISKVGQFRVPVPPGRFAVITSVQPVIVAMGAGWTVEVNDRNTTLGPMISTYDPTPDFANATVDVVIRGYGGPAASGVGGAGTGSGGSGGGIYSP
ncbi:MAG: host specificity factor TipJ family phage tail protein [Phycisphaerales bacterium]